VLGLPNYSLLLVMACFWVVFWLVATQLVGPVGRILDERERRNRAAAETLETAQHRLEEALTRCERELAVAAAEAQKDRSALRTAGEQARRAKLEAARERSQERLAQLDVELRAASAEARGRLRERCGELAHEIAVRLLGRRVA
jgi:F-type H+-transporting ATPase subunit b